MTELASDCGNCLGLCCVALTLVRSADFALDKPAGQPCPNLADDLRCGIHAELRTSGFRGCTTYECFGAGQRISTMTFAGLDWRRDPEVGTAMYDAFAVLRQLHEMLFYLADLVARPAVVDDAGLLLRVTALQSTLTRVAGGHGDQLRGVDVDAIRAEVGPVLAEASVCIRAEQRGRELPRADLVGKDFVGADLVGKDFVGADLAGANLRGALLIGAHLREADLRFADLLGADLRDADLSGGDLGGALFLTQQQVNAVRGDRRTTLPAGLARPAHWTSD